jgi:hypothetical protein
MATCVVRGDETVLCRSHHDPLVQAVGRTVRAPQTLIEDACQLTWIILLRRQPDAVLMAARRRGAPGVSPLA